MFAGLILRFGARTTAKRSIKPAKMAAGPVQRIVPLAASVLVWACW
jgi:hypothetical protein